MPPGGAAAEMKPVPVRPPCAVLNSVSACASEAMELARLIAPCCNVSPLSVKPPGSVASRSPMLVPPKIVSTGLPVVMAPISVGSVKAPLPAVIALARIAPLLTSSTVALASTLPFASVAMPLTSAALPLGTEATLLIRCGKYPFVSAQVPAPNPVGRAVRNCVVVNPVTPLEAPAPKPCPTCAVQLSQYASTTAVPERLPANPPIVPAPLTPPVAKTRARLAPLAMPAKPPTATPPLTWPVA